MGMLPQRFILAHSLQKIDCATGMAFERSPKGAVDLSYDCRNTCAATHR